MDIDNFKNQLYKIEKVFLQENLKRNMAQETLEGTITSEMINEEICRRLQDDVYDEYLVDGALLTCSSATWENFQLSDDDCIEIDGVEEKQKDGKATEYLRVPENPMSANKLRYATVADTKQEWNIIPFPCNCMVSALPEQEAKIRANKVDSQSHGVCKYLMDLEKEWENYDFKQTISLSVPRLFSEPVSASVSIPVPYKNFMDEEMPSELENAQMSEIWSRDSAQKKKGITRTSVLFCKHGGFIYPLTSGQTVLLDGLTEFLSTYNFTGKQYMALYEIMGYFERNPELCIGTSIFVFEGLATPRTDEEAKWNGVNKYHPNGQFGAIAIVTVDGRLEYALLKASTLPDDMETYATICEGIYDIKNGKHKGYAAMWLNDNKGISAYNSIDGDDDATEIHFHMACALHSDHPGDGSYSQGCITIPMQDYLEFGMRVKFLNENAKELEEKWKNASYKDGKKMLIFEKYTEDFNGYMVIDRQYYDDTEGYLKFNGPRGKE